MKSPEFSNDVPPTKGGIDFYQLEDHDSAKAIL